MSFKWDDSDDFESEQEENVPVEPVKIDKPKPKKEKEPSKKTDAPKKERPKKTGLTEQHVKDIFYELMDGITESVSMDEDRLSSSIRSINDQIHIINQGLTDLDSRIDQIEISHRNNVNRVTNVTANNNLQGETKLALHRLLRRDLRRNLSAGANGRVSETRMIAEALDIDLDWDPDGHYD